MYQGLQSLQNNPYYQAPYNQQYQRLAQLEQSQQMAPNYAAVSAQGYLKGRPVVSIEEARASQIDLDGSLFIFTDIGNKKIYTKQINLDGTATLNTYSLVENVAPAAEEISYVTKEELKKEIALIREELLKSEKERKNLNESNGTDIKKSISKQPSF